MGKSTASCFKIIACGSDSVDNDDLQILQSKAPSDERGWSFRKRSSRHQVLNNTVISEAPSPLNKQSTEPNAADIQVKTNLTVPEKASINQWAEEKKEVSALLDSTASRKDECAADIILDEASIIVIQATIRGYLARKVLLKQKNIIKLQAAVRGHLVRRHAVGTLRCMQGIAKIQALVRARHTRLLIQGSGDFEMKNANTRKDDIHLTHLMSNTEARPSGLFSYPTTDKLLSNKFAHQLLESTPRTKSITIKCDPSKSDSAWKWLERWMSVSSAKKELQESGPAAEQHEQENVGHPDGKGDILLPSDYYSESKDLRSTERASAETSENDDNLITYDADNLDLRLRNIDESNSRYEGKESDKEETENEKFSNKQPENEAKRLSRKASNPAFIVAQSKFESVSSASTSAKLTILPIGDLEVESRCDMVSPSINQPVSFREIGFDGPSISNASAVQITGSECGTELSISSTLDSPDRSEAGVNDLEHESKVSDVTNHPRRREHLGLEANGDSSILGTELSYANVNQLERHESIDSAAGNCVDSVIAAGSPPLEKKPEVSQEASPRSHMTILESQATPPSQVSDKPKRRSEANIKSRSSSADKRSLSTPNQDSSPRTSLEQSQKEHKTGKRRSSFGPAKPDQTDHEPGDSNSSNSLPSYMQATESAKAKAIANGSPRSSPDVQEKDIYIKNRHSLPGINGCQGSPRVHRPLSQAQQNMKGNGIHSPQERKWKR